MSKDTAQAVDRCVEAARRYPVTVVAVAGGEPPFRAYAADWPHLLAGGDTPEEAMACAVTAMADMLEYLQSQGRPAPEPLDDFSGQFSVRIPRTLHRALSERAATEGVSVNATLTYLLTAALGAEGRVDLPRPRKPRRKTAGVATA